MMRRDFDINLLYEAIDKRRVASGLTWSAVAAEIEERFTRVSPSTIKGIRKRKFVEGDGALQMLLWLGEAPERYIPEVQVRRAHRLTEVKTGVLRFDLQLTYGLIDSKRRIAGLTWGEVANQIDGVSASSLRRFEKGGRTSFPIIARVAGWLGVPVKQLTRESSW